MKAAPDNKQRELCRRLAEYAEVYPDSNFLDEMHAWGNESGMQFSVPQAEAIENALAGWHRRVNGAVFDPDRCPPGYVKEIWQLAGFFRDTMEAYGLPGQGRKVICAELARVIRRDRLDQDYAPWRDEPGGPGWVRMLTEVIRLFADENQDTRYPYRLHQDIAQPGVIRSLNDWLIDQEKLNLLIELGQKGALHAASTPPPAPERRLAVRAWIAGREKPMESQQTT